MALQSNDLFVIQSQTDSKLYKLRLSDLDAYLEGSSGVQFRGSVDLNNGAAAQTPAVTLPAANGDLYIVEADAASINADWIMEAGVTTASENDRIIWAWLSHQFGIMLVPCWCHFKSICLHFEISMGSFS